MHKVARTQDIDPLSDAYNYWIKKSVTEGLDILLSNKLHSNIDSEDEIIDRIWKLIPWAFDQSLIAAKRYVIILFTLTFSYFKLEISNL